MNECETKAYLLDNPGGWGRATLGEQLSLEASNLSLELPQHGVLGIFIDAGLVGNVLGSVGIAQRAQRLLIIVACWPNVGHHDSLGVAP